MSRNSDEYIIRFEFPNVFEAIENFLKPQRSGFELVYYGEVPHSFPSIFYQSSQCQIRIQCLRDRPWEEIEMHTSYGRLHAPLDKDIIEWQNERCYCWHNLGKPLMYFLDGQSPAEANSLEFIIPRTSREFLELSKDKGWAVPEHSAREHAFIWERYGQRFFDLFDLHYPDLWEEYANFFREYERIRNEKSQMRVMGIDTKPPRYKIC